jgi:hypothetical protein
MNVPPYPFSFPAGPGPDPAPFALPVCDRIRAGYPTAHSHRAQEFISRVRQRIIGQSDRDLIARELSRARDVWRAETGSEIEITAIMDDGSEVR